jgi:hypothetical protein
LEFGISAVPAGDDVGHGVYTGGRGTPPFFAHDAYRADS